MIQKYVLILLYNNKTTFIFWGKIILLLIMFSWDTVFYGVQLNLCYSFWNYRSSFWTCSYTYEGQYINV